MTTLHEQLATAIAEAKQALEGGDLEKGKELRQRAESIKAAIEELKAIEGISSAVSEPMRPDLPKNGDGTAPKQPEQRPENGAVKAAYVTRFGEPDTYVKAILTDLHGRDYEAKYWAQKAAFNKYLRYGETSLTSEDRSLLHEVVMTPNAVKAALMQGVDDIKAMKATMVEATDTLGGYIVPIDFQARVIERLRGITVMRGRASQVNTSRDRVEFPKATGGDSQYTSAVRVTWVDETPTAGTAETNLTFGLEGIPVYTVMAETPLSRNLIEDAAFNLEAYLAEKFAEAAAIDEDNQFLTGDGVGKPQGLLPGGSNTLSLTEANSGSASALTWNGLISLVYSIDAQYRQNAVWIAEKATYEAISKLQNSGGDYLWRAFQFEGGANGQPLTLMGYPVLEQEAMPSVAANAYPIIFGDLRGYTIVDRVGMTVERYLDSQTARQNLVYYVMRRRLGGQPVETWRFAVQKVAA